MAALPPFAKLLADRTTVERRPCIHYGIINRPGLTPITCEVIDPPRSSGSTVPNTNAKHDHEVGTMDRRSVLTMTTALGAGGMALHASELLAQQKQHAGGGRSSFIQRTDGTTLYYKDWGTGSPVVFVNSAGLTSDMWGYQMIPLTAQGMRCVAFDRRGHGKSSDPGRGYDFDTLADDLAAVIETLDLRNVTLIGHSMGCAEITRYLTRHGSSRITRVALLSPTTPFLLKTPDNPEGIVRIPRLCDH
jgi:non-heme chloroperoxidase